MRLKTIIKRGPRSFKIIPAAAKFTKEVDPENKVKGDFEIGSVTTTMFPPRDFIEVWEKLEAEALDYWGAKGGFFNCNKISITATSNFDDSEELFIVIEGCLNAKGRAITNPISEFGLSNGLVTDLENCTFDYYKSQIREWQQDQAFEVKQVSLLFGLPAATT